MEVKISTLAINGETFFEGFKKAVKSAKIAAAFAVIKKRAGSLHKELKGVIPL